MSYTKTIVLLARSRKPGGTCIAGKEISGENAGEWVRPVSGRPAGELYPQEMRTEDNKLPVLLDVVRITFKGKRDHAYQAENHTIDNNFYWKTQRRMTVAEVMRYVDTFKGHIWDNGYSTRYGENDQVPVTKASDLGESLALVAVDELTVSVCLEWPEFNEGRRKVRGSFNYNSARYTLSISDPRIENYYLAKPDGDYRLGPVLLCISLAEPYKEHAYKVIAGVILQQPS